MKPAHNTERVGVRANYIVRELEGSIEFVARLPCAGQPTGAVERARRAVARRLQVPLRDVRITGVITY